MNVTAAIAKTPSASSLPTTVSRAAGMALTKAMSKDLGPDNIRVNTVCIGLIRSDQIEKLWKKTAPDLTFEEYSHDDRHQIPLGRIGRRKKRPKRLHFSSPTLLPTSRGHHLILMEERLEFYKYPCIRAGRSAFYIASRSFLLDEKIN